MNLEVLNNFQAHIFSQLKHNQRLQDMVGDAIFDASPAGSALPKLFIQIGDGRFEDRSSQTHRLEYFFFDISVFATIEHFSKLQDIASLVREALLTKNGLSPKVQAIWFKSAKIFRLDQGQLKRQILTFKTSLDLSSEVETW